jgi:hypothetical protein
MVEGSEGLMQTDAEELDVDELPRLEGGPRAQSINNWLEYLFLNVISF